MRYIFSCIAIVMWGLFFLLGTSLIVGGFSQRAPGYPNIAQLLYYIGIPFFVVAGLATLLIVKRAIKDSRLIGISIALIVFLPVYAIFITGGV